MVRLLRVPASISTVLRLIERAAAYCQGKGYGAGTVTREVAAVASQLNTTPRLGIDIGANVGKYAFELRRRFPEIEIHLFEPSSVNLEKLRERFGGDNRITICSSALSDIAGRATLFANVAGSGLGSLTKRKLDHFGIKFDCQESVSTMRFETYWKENLESRPIDIAKLDVEGHELDVLKGFGAALQSTKVVQFEFGGCNIDTRTYYQEFFYLFFDQGFSLYRISPIGLEKIARYREVDEFFTTTNFLAINPNGT